MPGAAGAPPFPDGSARPRRSPLACGPGRRGGAWRVRDRSAALLPRRNEVHSLKRRAANATRPVPIPPQFVRTLLEHIERFGVAPDGRLFRNQAGNYVDAAAYGTTWARSRKSALTRTELASGLAKRPYGLPHAGISFWCLPEWTRPNAPAARAGAPGFSSATTPSSWMGGAGAAEPADPARHHWQNRPRRPSRAAGRAGRTFSTRWRSTSGRARRSRADAIHDRPAGQASAGDLRAL